MKPRCGFNPELSKEGLEKILPQRGVQYVHLSECGNLFHGMDDSAKRYKVLVRSAGAVITQNLRVLMSRQHAAGAGGVAIMCACGTVTTCHRGLLSDWLRVHRGVTVVHLHHSKPAQTWQPPPAAADAAGDGAQ